MLMQAVRGIFFFILVAISAVGLLVLLPFLKEGASREEIPLLLGGAGMYLLLGGVWWLFVGRVPVKAALGWAFLLAPILAYLALAGVLILAYVRGERLSRSISIESYSEEPIFWPGFDDPVGWRIFVGLSHPPEVEALVTAPEIRMGPEVDIPSGDLSNVRTWSGGYLKAERLGMPETGPLALLKPVGFQRLYENPEGTGAAGRWLAERRFAPGSHSEHVYHLFPGHLDYLASENKVCMTSSTFGLPACGPGQTAEQGCVRTERQPERPAVYHQGTDLSAIWAAFGSYDMAIDLSRTLTRTMRRESRLQGDPAIWSAMQKRLEPAGLAAAGYTLCPSGDDTHSASRLCYCRAGAPPG
jgi:hypothetical protein